MRSFDSSSEINRIRHQINEQCCLAGARETGIYRLSIPTGGGKTLASLNFALHHALKTGKRRIIYVIPYLSITTQTAKTFRDVLGLNSDSDVLLEHYSTAGMQRSADVADNASSEFEDAGEHQRKLAAERWDNPIIVTTMVEFLETVMSARGTKLRKFHNMADSVIIFDEIQSLPMNTINLFNEIVSFLSKITNSTILLCSATQPLLEKTKRENLLLSEKPDLIAETESYEDKLRRTRIVASAENKSCDELGQIIYQQARKNGNCLAIVNLKKEAREIFQCLERLDVNHEFELIHLSTAMCGRHRTDCLNRIGALLDPGNPKPVICVSTQLIEAGVDISFACVVRAMAGLDSIMQAAGRCNRNGESVEPKNVYVYPLKDEDSMERYLPDIAMGKQLTLQIMENYPGKDLLSSNILEQYYDMLLRKKDGNGKGGYTDCPIRGRAEGATTAYDLLSFNECDRSQFTNTTGGKYGLCFAQAFQTVSDNFHVIPDVTHNVVVPYGQATELLDMLHRGELSEKISVLRRLQEYTVSLFDDDYRDLARKHAISLANEDFGVFSVFVQSDDRSDDGAKSLSDRFNTYLKTLPKDEQKQKNVVFGKVCERWLDVRSFGQVFAFKKAKDTDEVSIGVRGPVSIQPAFSINPIAIDDVQITKSVNSETTDSGKKSSDTMGMKYRVSGRAVYVTYGSISPQLAERTGFSAEDAEKIKEALVTLFENDESSARPSGSMEVLDVVWFAHNCKGGQYSSAKVHRSVSVDADGTVNVDDASIPGLRYEVIEGR
jgi:CRISPR-associated endonuclease/helicase Cas3